MADDKFEISNLSSVIRHFPSSPEHPPPEEAERLALSGQEQGPFGIDATPDPLDEPGAEVHLDPDLGRSGRRDRGRSQSSARRGSGSEPVAGRSRTISSRSAHASESGLGIVRTRRRLAQLGERDRQAPDLGRRVGRPGRAVQADADHQAVGPGAVSNRFGQDSAEFAAVNLDVVGPANAEDGGCGSRSIASMTATAVARASLGSCSGRRPWAAGVDDEGEGQASGVGPPGMIARGPGPRVCRSRPDDERKGHDRRPRSTSQGLGAVVAGRVDGSTEHGLDERPIFQSDALGH